MRVEAALASVLALSLGIKVAASGTAPGMDPLAVAQDSAVMLAQSGFEARTIRLPRSPGVVAVALKGTCRIVAGDYPPYGTYQDVYRQIARPLGTLRYAYRGRIHDEEPKFRALSHFYLWRELRRVGVDIARAPVVAVAASPACDPSSLPWQRLATIEREWQRH